MLDTVHLTSRGHWGQGKGGERATDKRLSP